MLMADGPQGRPLVCRGDNPGLQPRVWGQAGPRAAPRVEGRPGPDLPVNTSRSVRDVAMIIH